MAWYAGHVKWVILAATAASLVRLVALVLLPYVLGRAIDTSLQAGITTDLWRYGAMLVGLGAIAAAADALAHILEVHNWMKTAFSSVLMVGNHVARTGAATTRVTSSGKVVATVATDADYIGNIMEVLSGTVGAMLAYLLVAGLLFQESPIMAAIVLLGLPLVTAANLLVAIPLEKRQSVHREAQGELTALATDTVSGLRILRGIGGEDVFTARYREQSQSVRRAGVKVANTAAVFTALQVFLPGLLVVVVVWVSAALTVRGDLSPGGLVAFYGYTAFLRHPVAYIGFLFIHATRARVAARKVLQLLDIQPLAGALTDSDTPGTPLHVPQEGPVLRDSGTDLEVAAGQFTVLVSPTPDVAAAQLARFARIDDRDSALVRFAGMPVVSFPLSDVRATIVYSGASAQLFSGKLAEGLDVRGGADRDDLLYALDVADAHDVLDSMPDGLDGEITEKGHSLSGGQRQRVALARAVATSAPILLLVEPTSAVDAYTERRIAANLAADRAGRTTVVSSASPLVLEHADSVVFLDADGVRARGTHRELMKQAMAGNPAAQDYYRVVTRRDPEEDHAAAIG